MSGRAAMAKGEQKYMWYENKGKENDVVLSTRVRLARNITGYPFPGKMTDEQKKEVIEKVKGAFGDEWDKIEFDKIGEDERAEMLDRHLVSREFLHANGEKLLVKNDEKSVYIMTPEEDHLRIQSVVAGYDIDAAMAAAFEAEEQADRSLGFAYNEQYGYITHCPTNVGTGMRISVMVHLPAYTARRGMRDLALQLARIGMTVRGMGGEGSGSEAGLYQISNQTTLGISEEDTAKKIREVVDQIIKNEREMRAKMSEDGREDLAENARRTYGILMYTQCIGAHEVLSMYSDLRYASELGLTDIPTEKIDEIFVRCMPKMHRGGFGHGHGEHAHDGSERRERGKKRAEMIREILAK